MPVLNKHDKTMIRQKTDAPRGLLRRGVADTTRYRHVRYHPSPDLVPYIEHFWVVEWDLRGKEPELAETLPHPSVHMVFESGGNSRIHGPSRAKFSRVLKNRGSVFAVKFTPGGFYPFAKIAVSTFSDRQLPLRTVFGADGDDLDRTVLSESADAARIAVIENFLRARRPAPDDNVMLAGQLVYSVAKDRSILTVEHLVTRYALTVRTLQRLFRTYVGVSPKWVIQRYRLHEAAEQLAARHSINHASLAAELGYSDQAHFGRDFKRIIGMTPAAYAKTLMSKQ
jgi:AraC-like DNA-binding protein